MTNVIHLPRSGNHLRQRAAHRRLIAPLNERIARDDLAVKQLAFYADPNAETEAAMLRARDNWTEAHEAIHGEMA